MIRADGRRGEVAQQGVMEVADGGVRTVTCRKYDILYKSPLPHPLV